MKWQSRGCFVGYLSQAIPIWRGLGLLPLFGVLIRGPSKCGVPLGVFAVCRDFNPSDYLIQGSLLTLGPTLGPPA